MTTKKQNDKMLNAIEGKDMKKIKEIIEDQLDWYFLNQTGYRKLNGGYAEVEKLKIKDLGDDWYNVKGYLISGCDDMGDGHSSKYTDEIDLKVKIENDKIIKIENENDEDDEDDEDDE